MTGDSNTLAIMLFSEILGTDQILRNRLSKAQVNKTLHNEWLE